MTLVLSVIFCLVSGYVVVSFGFFRSASFTNTRMLRASLSVGFGVGILSVIFFLVRVLGTGHLIVVDLLLLAFLIAVFLLRQEQTFLVGNPPRETADVSLPLWLRSALQASFAFALCAALYSAAVRSIAHPHGEGWDAFAIWNLHARFLFRGGDHWRDGFNPMIPWSHPDYPLLLPSAIAHFWSALGHESTVVPAVLGIAFTFSTVGLLFFSLATLRSRTHAMLGGLALLSTPLFIGQGSSQYADVPLSFFFLASMVLIQLYACDPNSSLTSHPKGLLVLAGVAAGFGVWTKNEGLLFLFSIFAAQGLVWIFGKRKSTRPAVEARSAGSVIDTAFFLIGTGPFLALVAWFKRSVAFSNELFSGQSAMLHKILDCGRYWAIVKWFVKDFLRFGEWWLVPGTLLLVLFYFVMADKREPRNSQKIWNLILTLSFTLVGYFAIYVITPYDLYWHLRFSLNRLFLQLWPCAIFLFFLAIPLKMPEKSQNGTEFIQN